MDGRSAVAALEKDITILLNGIAGKKPEDLDFAKVTEYLNLLVSESERIAAGVYAKDNRITYTEGNEISFDKGMSR